MALFEGLEFHVLQCLNKKKYIKQIEENGGTHVKAFTDETIVLGEADQRRPANWSGKSIYNVTFIGESITNNYLQDLDFYELEDGSQPIIKKRKKYTDEEDQAIIDYIRKSSESPKGAKVWKRMETEKVTSHPWQSMKDRYNKTLSKKVKRNNSNSPHSKNSLESTDVEDQEEVQEEEQEHEEEEEEEEVKETKSSKSKKKQATNNNNNNNNNNSSSSSSTSDVNIIVIKNIRNSVKEMMENTKLPINIIYHALLVNNGNVTLASKYLTSSLTKEDPLPWLIEEDQLLLENKSPENLLTKRTRDQINSRIKFLESGIE